MARKAAIENSENVREAFEEFKMLTELRYEMAWAAFNHQDDKTQAVIRRICDRLRLGASGYIKVRVNPPRGSLVPVKITDAMLDANILFVATEILKDLAMFDVRIENYSFPPGLCVSCAAEIEAPKRGKRG